MHKNVTILSTLDLHLSNLSSTILKEFSLKRKVCSFIALAWVRYSVRNKECGDKDMKSWVGAYRYKTLWELDLPD